MRSFLLNVLVVIFVFGISFCGFGQDFQLFMATKEQILRAVKAEGDEEYLKELEKLFEGYELTRIPG